MARDNGYSILLDFEFEGFSSVNEKFEKIVNKLKKNAKIDFNDFSSDFSNITKALNDLKQEFNKIENVKVNIDASGSYTQIERLKNDSNDILNIIKQFNSDGKLVGVSSSITRQNSDLTTQKEIYNKLNSLQNDEFKIKTKLLSASKEEETILKARLSLNQELQKQGNIFLNNNNLTDEKEYNNLLYKRKELEYELSLTQAKQTNKYNLKIEKEKIKYQQDYISTWEKLLNEQDKVENKIKEIQSIQLQMTQSLNVKKSQGWLNNSTYTNIQKQIDKINVDTPKKRIQELFKTINNIDKSSSKVYELSNYITEAKETIERVKSNNNDFLNIDGSVEKVKQLEEYLKQAESMLNKLKKNSLSVDNISYKDIKNNLSSSTNEVNKIEKENKAVKDLIETKTRLLEIEKSRVVRTYGDKINTSSIDEAIKKLKSMNNQPLSNVKSEIKGIDLGLKELKESARNSESFISKMGKSLNSFGLYLDIGDVVRELGQAFKQTIDVVIDMDSALSDLNKVCNYSSQQLEYMKQSAISMGKELGKSVTEIVNAQAEIGKAYKNEEDINTLTKASTIGANVMDGLTSDQVAKGLTTVITAMDKQVSDSMSILDSMNEVQNNYRISADDMLEALSEVASTAKTSGTELANVEGYITAIAEATGESGSEIGNALRSMMSRVYKIGAEGMESAGKPEKQLADIGVAVRDAEGNFRNFNDILDDLNGKWSSLSSTERIATAQQVAGIQRYNQFISLMNNYSTAISASETALNSQGSALQENSIYMESAQAKIEQLKATMQEKAINFIDSHTVKIAIEGITELVKIFGDLPTVVGLCTTALMIFKGKAIEGGIVSILKYAKGLKTLAMTEGIVSTATTKMAIAMNKLGDVIISNPLGALAVVLTSLYAGFKQLGNQTDRLKDSLDKLDEAKEKMDDFNDASSLITQYEKLQKTIKDNSTNTEELTSAKQELLEVQKRLAELFPNLIGGFDEEGNAIVTNVDKVQKKIKEGTDEAVKDMKASYKMARETLDENTNGGDWYEYLGIRNSAYREDNVSKKYIDKYFEESQSGASTLSSINAYKMLLEMQKDGIKLTKDQLEEYKRLRDFFTDFNSETEKIYSTTKNIKDLQGMEIFDLKTGELIDAVKYYSDLNESSQNYDSQLDGINEKVKSFSENLSKSLNTKQDSEDLSSVLEEKSKAVEFLQTIQENGKMTNNVIQRLLKEYPDLGAKIKSVAEVQDYLNNKIKEQDENAKSVYRDMMINSSDYFNSTIKDSEEYKNYLSSMFNALASINSEYYTFDANNMKSQLENCQDFAQARLTIETELYKAQESLLAEYLKKVKNATSVTLPSGDIVNNNMYETSGKNAGKVKDKYKGIVDWYNKEQEKIRQQENQYQQLIDNLGQGIDTSIDFSNMGVGTNSTSEKDYSVDDIDLEIDLFHDEENALERLKNKYDLLDKQKSKAYGQQKVNLINQQIKLIEEEERKTNDLLSAYNRRKEELKSQLLSKGVGISFNGDIISNYNEVIEVQQNLANSIQSTSEESKKAKQQAQDTVKDLKDLMDEYTDLVLNDIANQQSALVELQNQWKELQDELVDLNAKGEDDIANVIKNYADERYDTLKEEVDKEIELLEKRKEALQDSWNEDDYNDTIAEKQKNINELEQKLQDATISGNATKIKDLTEQLNEAQKDLQETIVQNQRDKALDDYDTTIDELNDKKEAYDKEKEDLLDAKNLTKLVQQALETGYVTIGNKLLDLSSLTNDYITNTTVGNANIKQSFDDINESIQNACYAMKQLGNLTNSGVNFSNLFGSQISYVSPISLSDTLLNNMSLTKAIQPISVKVGDVNVTTDTKSLKADLTTEFGKTIDNIVNQINNANKGY